MDLNIKNKRVIVMGGSSGIGKAVAKSLAEEGAKVVICARNQSNLDKTSRELNLPLAVQCDLDVPGSAVNLIQTVAEKLGGVDILVANTGGPAKGSICEITSNQWMQNFQGLWMSVVESIRTVLPYMKEQRWGRILLVTSVAAKEAMPLLTVSNGLRSGLLGLTKSISNEVASYGITINAVLPGYTRTERLQALGIAEDKIISQIPAGRLASPNEMADLMTFLASDRAAYITGQAIACDGGYMKGI